MADAWSEREVDLCIDSYFTMLRLELEGDYFNKADFRRRLRLQIDRSDGSVEFKHQNISAVLNDMGSVFIGGYKPARNVQTLLRTRVEERFAESAELRSLMLRAVAAPAPESTIGAGSRASVPEVSLRDPEIVRQTSWQVRRLSGGRVGE